MTPEGEKIAVKLINSHKIISRFLNKVLCIEKDIAEKNACRIEHIIDDAVLSKLLKYIEYVEGCPMVGAEFIEKFGDFCKHGLDESECKKCMASRSGK